MVNYKKAAFVGGGISLVGALAFGLKTLYEYKEAERESLYQLRQLNNYAKYSTIDRRIFEPDLQDSEDEAE